MSSIFTEDQHSFPYKYSFPGQGTNEKILFITRENKVMLILRLIAVIGVSLSLAFVSVWIGSLLKNISAGTAVSSIPMIGVPIALLIALVGFWWASSLWKKSIAIVTTSRLIKFVYTTPFNRHVLTLPLDMIVDIGSYTKGFSQALLKLGTFTARSSASSSGLATDDPSRINKKYFYIENVTQVEDLQHYVTKLLEHFRAKTADLSTFRPFIPHLKGERREAFMKEYPEYWS